MANNPSAGIPASGGAGTVSIESASIGYDEAGMREAINEINTNLIDNVVGELNKNVPELISNVDTYWVGAAAEAFKNKITTDNEKVVNALESLKEQFEAEFNQMMYNAANSDNAIAETINAQINN